MDKTGQTTLHNDLDRLEELVNSIESRVFSTPTVGGRLETAKNPSSVHVLDNVRNRIIEVSARLEGVLQGLKLL